MSKSRWKIPFISSKFFSNYRLSNKTIILKDRASVISRLFLNRHFSVFNGKSYISFDIKSAMIGHKFGEFSITKKLGTTIHKRAKKKR